MHFRVTGESGRHFSVGSECEGKISDRTEVSISPEIFNMNCPFSSIPSSASSGCKAGSAPGAIKDEKRCPGIGKGTGNNKYGQSTDSNSIVASSTSDDLNLSSLSSAIISLIVPQVSFSLSLLLLS